MKQSFKILFFALAISCLLFSFAKDDASSDVKDYPQANMTAEVTYSGDISSQMVYVSIAGLWDKNENDHVGKSIKLINDQTKKSDIIWNLKNAQFKDYDKYTFTSDGKVTKTMVNVSFNEDRPAGLEEEKQITITVKIFFDGKLADEQTFNKDKLFTKSYTVNVK